MAKNTPSLSKGRVKANRKKVQAALLLFLLFLFFQPLVQGFVLASGDPIYYDFIDQASEASWSSGTGNLPFPGSDTDERGFVLYRYNARLEDGSIWGRVLETHPEWVNNGWILGRYPEITVPQNAHLRVNIGFLLGATGTDGATFEVYFEEFRGALAPPVKYTIFSHKATYDGKLDSITVDLGYLAGKKGNFVLYVNAGQSSGQDWAAWAEAQIVIERKLPDLVVEDLWQEGDKICFRIRNSGEASLPATAFYNALYVDGIKVAENQISLTGEMPPGQVINGCFEYTLEPSPPQHEVKVCTDSKLDVEETDEENNCLEKILTAKPEASPIPPSPSAVEPGNGAIVFSSYNKTARPEGPLSEPNALYLSSEDGEAIVRIVPASLEDDRKIGAIMPYYTPDGTYLAFVKWEGSIESTEIYLRGPEGEVRLTNNNRPDICPAVSLSGGPFEEPYVVYSSGTGDTFNLFVQGLESGRGTRITDGEFVDIDPCPSPDGSKVVFSSNRMGDGKFYLWIIDLDSSTISPIIEAREGTPVEGIHPSWSSDGTWIAFSKPVYVGAELGYRYKLAVVRPDGSEIRILKESSDYSYMNPSWAPDRPLIVFESACQGPDVYDFELEVVDLYGRGWSLGKVTTFSMESHPAPGLTFIDSPRPVWFSPSKPEIIPAEITAKAEEHFEAGLHVYGGVPPYTWANKTSLPEGLALSREGIISGTPTTPELSREVVVAVEDSKGMWDTETIGITVLPKVELSLLFGNLAFFSKSLSWDNWTRHVRGYYPLYCSPQHGYIEIIGGVPPYTVSLDLVPPLRWSLDGSRIIIESIDENSNLEEAIRAATTGSFQYVNIHVKDSIGSETGMRNVGVYCYPISYGANRNWSHIMLNFKVTREEIEDLDRIQSRFDVSGDARDLRVLRKRRIHAAVGDTLWLYLEMPDDSSYSFPEGVSTLIGTLTIRLPIKMGARPGEDVELVRKVWIPVHRYRFRYDFGLPMVNKGWRPISWDEWCYFFDESDCCFLGTLAECPECAPQAIAFTAWLALSGVTRNGVCFGMCKTRWDIHEGVIQVREGLSWENWDWLTRQAGWPDYDTMHGSDLLDAIRRNHLWQYSMQSLGGGFLDTYIIGVGEAIDPSQRQCQELIERVRAYKNGELESPIIVLICKSWREGHAMVAYDLEELSDGKIAIKVYDPNKPFRFMERSDHKSTINLTPHLFGYSWKYDLGGGEVWGGSLGEFWHPIGSIPMDLLTGNPDGISRGDLLEIGLDLLAELVFGSAHTEQIEDSQGRFFYTEDGWMNWDPSTGIPLAARIPLIGVKDEEPVPELYFLAENNTYLHKIVGDSSGTYNLITEICTDGLLAFSNVETEPGSVDMIGLDPSNLSISFSPKSREKSFFLEFEKMSRENLYGRRYFLRIIRFPKDNLLGIKTDPNGEFLQLSNDGLREASYDLKLVCTLPDRLLEFSRDGLSIGPGEIHRIVPNWDDLKTVRIMIDKDGDGHWDETIDLSPSSEGPVADAGPDVFAVAGPNGTATVILNGTGSYSPLGRSLTYRWVGNFLEGGGVSTEPTPNLTFPVGAWPVELIVSDGERDSYPDFVLVRVAPMPHENQTDTDGDGVPDDIEEGFFHTNSKSQDTDGDGVPDGEDPNPLDPHITSWIHAKPSALRSFWTLIKPQYIAIALAVAAAAGITIALKGRKPKKAADVAEKLKRLEERYRKGEISEKTYKELKEKLERRN